MLSTGLPIKSKYIAVRSARLLHVKKPLNNIPTRLNNATKHVDKTLGYVRIYCPEHPKANTRGWIYEHRALIENRLGRYLKSEEHVHHINGIRWDNRLSNLEVLTASEHSRLHRKQGK